MVKKILIFVCGASLGATASWYFTKRKYEALARTEIDAAREAFYKKEAVLRNMNKPDISEMAVEKLEPIEEVAEAEVPFETHETLVVEETEEEDNYDYEEDQFLAAEDIIEEEGYDTMSIKERMADAPAGKKPEKVKKVKIRQPYIIDESDYNTFTEHEKNNLTLYADDILADDLNEIGDYTRIHDCIPLATKKLLISEALDAIYIRDEQSGFDYEITYDPRTYFVKTGIDITAYK